MLLGFDFLNREDVGLKTRFNTVVNIDIFPSVAVIVVFDILLGRRRHKCNGVYKAPFHVTSLIIIG